MSLAHKTNLSLEFSCSLLYQHVSKELTLLVYSLLSLDIIIYYLFVIDVLGRLGAELMQ